MVLIALRPTMQYAVLQMLTSANSKILVYTIL